MISAEDRSVMDRIAVVGDMLETTVIGKEIYLRNTTKPDELVFLERGTLVTLIGVDPETMEIFCIGGSSLSATFDLDEHVNLYREVFYIDKAGVPFDVQLISPGVCIQVGYVPSLVLTHSPTEAA